MKIAYIGNNYPEERMIINKVPEYNYVRLKRLNDPVFLFYRICEYIFKSSFFKNKREFQSYNLFFPFVNGYNIIHHFNGLIYSNISWVSTFESIFPADITNTEEEYLQYLNKAATHIQDSLCKGVIALSEWGFNQTLKYWKEYLPQKLYTDCRKKIFLINPPQQVLISKEEIERKFQNVNTLELVFVGREFQRKGGINLINALSKIKENRNFHLTIISDFKPSMYSNFTDFTMVDNEIIEQIKSYEWITVLENISNERVLQILKSAHIGFLPTYIDTYGFSVLEMQASGCPVVTTNINALATINSSEEGWVIDLEKYTNSYEIDYDNSINEITSIIDNKLNKIVLEIFDNTDIECIKEKALHCVDKIKKFHNPVDYQEQIKKIYNS